MRVRPVLGIEPVRYLLVGAQIVAVIHLGAGSGFHHRPPPHGQGQKIRILPFLVRLRPPLHQHPAGQQIPRLGDQRQQPHFRLGKTAGVDEYQIETLLKIILQNRVHWPA